MTEVQTDWKNAPEGATHYIHVQSDLIFFKIKSDAVFCFTKSGGWKWSMVTAAEAIRDPDYVAIPRPAPTAIPEPKKLTQAVFDGLPPEYLWAAVDGNGELFVYANKDPVKGFNRWQTAEQCRFFGEGFDATDWQNSLIEREPSVAEILEAFAANPPNFDALINSVANAQTLAEAQAEIERLKAGHDRYEIVRKLNVVQFQKLYTAALKGCVTFDQMVDLYGEFFDEN